MAAAPNATWHGGLRIRVHTAIGTALSQWQTFEKEAAGTFYQTSLWCRAWADTAGASFKVAIRVMVAENDAGEIQFILPLQIRRRQGVAVLEFLCSPHNGYGYGLYDRAFLPEAAAWFAAHWSAVLALAGPVDAVALNDMPDRLLGARHPLAAHFNLKGANPSFAMRLTADFDSIHKRKRDGEDRRMARKKEQSLAQLGEVTFGLPAGRAGLHRTLDQMFEQQENRLAERGVRGVFGPRERQFIHRLAELQDENNPVLAPYRLTCGGEVLAIMLGGLHGGGYWALISSLAPGPARKLSPGDLALRRTIAACCEAGLSFLDFSAGDQPYKRAWADDTILLRTALQAVTFKGLAWTVLMGARLWIKRRIKSSPLLMPLSAGLRRMVFGRRPLKS